MTRGSPGLLLRVNNCFGFHVSSESSAGSVHPAPPGCASAAARPCAPRLSPCQEQAGRAHGREPARIGQPRLAWPGPALVASPSMKARACSRHRPGPARGSLDEGAGLDAPITLLFGPAAVEDSDVVGDLLSYHQAKLNGEKVLSMVVTLPLASEVATKT